VPTTGWPKRLVAPYDGKCPTHSVVTVGRYRPKHRTGHGTESENRTQRIYVISVVPTTSWLIRLGVTGGIRTRLTGFTVQCRNRFDFNHHGSGHRIRTCILRVKVSSLAVGRTRYGGAGGSRTLSVRRLQFYRLLPFPDGPYPLVEAEGIEPSMSDCKTDVFPLALRPHGCIHLLRWMRGKHPLTLHYFVIIAHLVPLVKSLLLAGSLIPRWA
jgi:hypothetical protein